VIVPSRLIPGRNGVHFNVTKESNMINDPMYVGIAPTTPNRDVALTTQITEPKVMRLVSSGEGKTKRVGSWDTLTVMSLSISHSVTKENAPHETNRSLVRLDLGRVDSEGRPVNLAAYCVIAHPQGGDFTQADAARASRTLGALLLYGFATAEDSFSEGFAGESSLVDRVIAGEP